MLLLLLLLLWSLLLGTFKRIITGMFFFDVCGCRAWGIDGKFLSRFF